MLDAILPGRSRKTPRAVLFVGVLDLDGEKVLHCLIQSGLALLLYTY